MWTEEVRARLEELIAGVPPEWLSRNGADIRAALGEIERLKNWEEAGGEFLADRDSLRVELAKQMAEVERLRKQLEIESVDLDMVEELRTLRAEVERKHAALVAEGEDKARLAAEVERLEGLILEVDNAYQQRGFPLVILSVESRRIRAALWPGRRSYE
jgi:ABC-type phosphate transport system auxiliary subunit